jgi:hypothetical protein
MSAGNVRSPPRQAASVARTRKIDPYLLAKTCARVAGKENALEYLKAAYDQHSRDLPGIGIDHAFAGLHDEPGFREIKSAMKLQHPQPE